MTTYWVNLYERGEPGLVGYFHATEHEAIAVAKQISKPLHYRIAVPIEVPDPPHVWKVGDWFQRTGGGTGNLDGPRRIVDIDGHGNIASHGRSASGHVFVVWESPCDAALINAIPCDPQQWWLDQQNERTGPS